MAGDDGCANGDAIVEIGSGVFGVAPALFNEWILFPRQQAK
jgi:hypothetical protein